MTHEATAIDRAFAAMTSAPGDERMRLAYFERIAEQELHLLLEGEVDGETVAPKVVTADGQAVALAFDRQLRLASCVRGEAAVLSLSGRKLARLLADNGLGLALNIGSPSETVLTAEEVSWLADISSRSADPISNRPNRFTAPGGATEELLRALDRKLPIATGLAARASLVTAHYPEGTSRLLLAFLDAVPGSEQALVALVAEMTAFADHGGAALEIAFLPSQSDAAARVEAVGLTFDLPEPIVRRALDDAFGQTDKPPRLR